MCLTSFVSLVSLVADVSLVTGFLANNMEMSNHEKVMMSFVGAWYLSHVLHENLFLHSKRKKAYNWYIFFKEGVSHGILKPTLHFPFFLLTYRSYRNMSS
jgi:hypothetical protein